MTRLLPIAILVSAAAIAADLFGPAHVVDGDSLVVAGRQVRLHGIDAFKHNPDVTYPKEV